MRKAFVLRVQNDDPQIALALAQSLLVPLGARGARVRADGLDGPHEGAQSAGPAVHVVTAARGLKGTSMVVGIHNEEGGVRWLAPIETSHEPQVAVQEILAFLETWGFIDAPQHGRARPATWAS